MFGPFRQETDCLQTAVVQSCPHRAFQISRIWTSIIIRAIRLNGCFARHGTHANTVVAVVYTAKQERRERKSTFRFFLMVQQRVSRLVSVSKASAELLLFSVRSHARTSTKWPPFGGMGVCGTGSLNVCACVVAGWMDTDGQSLSRERNECNEWT